MEKWKRKIMKKLSEKIQEDIRTYIEHCVSSGHILNEDMQHCDDICQIVVNNFKTLEQ